MPKYQDITGKRYERLTALRMSQSTRPTKWLCRCDCGVEKSFVLGDLNSGHVRSCGCLRREMTVTNNAKNKKLSASERLASMRRRIEEKSIPEPNSGCWLWLGALSNKGYGHMGISDYRTMAASRVSYMAFVCDPGDLNVLHRCDMPACVNPEHLFVGTQKENIQDCIAKGRFRPGGVLQPKI